MISQPLFLQQLVFFPYSRYGNSTKQYKVRVGDYHSLVPEEYEEEYAVDQIVLHPSYHSDSTDYDLALVRLSPGALGQPPGECVSFSRHVLPACLPMKRERVLKQASNCHITGWGDTGEDVSAGRGDVMVAPEGQNKSSSRFMLVHLALQITG